MHWMLGLLACLSLMGDGEPEAAEGWSCRWISNERLPARGFQVTRARGLEHYSHGLTPAGEPVVQTYGLDAFGYIVLSRTAPEVRRFIAGERVHVKGVGVARRDEAGDYVEVLVDGMEGPEPVALALLNSGELIALQPDGKLLHIFRGGSVVISELPVDDYTGMVAAPISFGSGEALVVSSVKLGVRILELVQRGSTYALSAELALVHGEGFEVSKLLCDYEHAVVYAFDGNRKTWEIGCNESSEETSKAVLDAPTRFLRMFAIARPLEQGDEAVPALRAMFASTDAEIDQFTTDNGRRAGIWALGRLAREKEETRASARLLLEECLKHDMAFVRALAVRALDVSFGMKAPDFTSILEDPAPSARREAAFAVGRAERTTSAPALLAALKLWDDAPLRFTIHQALQRVGGYSVVAARILEDYNPEWHDELFLILDLREKGAADALAGIALFPEAHYTLRARALRQLSRLDADEVAWDGRTVAEEAYEDALGDVSPLVRLVAIEALERRASESALSRASEVLARETNADVREALTRLIER